MAIEWIDRGIKTTPPKKPKKMTGTRFASVLGMNKWSTPFEMWCAISRVYEKPFEDTIYTIAGKTIEPKQAQFMKDTYFMTNLITPTDKFGPDYFKKTYGDFFPDSKIFGGMWDYLLVDGHGDPTTVLEMKTTKRAEDWVDDIPEYYALQAALYAYLLGVEDVVMVCTVLDPKDYENPDAVSCTVDNTFIRSFKLHERYPSFEEEYIRPAIAWWDAYVVTGMSPAFDEKLDAEILKALRYEKVDLATEDKASLLEEAENLQDLIEGYNAAIKGPKARLKTILDGFKEDFVPQMKTPDSKVGVSGRKWSFTVSCSDKQSIDTEAMKRDGIYEKYLVTKPVYTMRVTENKGE